jgi:hypothetical protein
LYEFTDISVGVHYSLFLYNGQLSSVGNNLVLFFFIKYSQLGFGDNVNSKNNYRNLPTLTNLNNITQIAASSYFTMFINQSGDFFSFGQNAV